jgi:phenylacetate-CoA ligase
MGADRNIVEIAWKAWWDERRGAAALAARQRTRLAALVAYARTCSPYYRSLYAGLPAGVDDPRLLPPVAKPDLMAHFDDWVTDPAVTRAGVERFVADETRAGDPFLGRYTVWTTSGTTGEPALLVHDERSWAVFNVLGRLRGLRGFLQPRDLLEIVRGGDRSAAVFVTGGHFGGYVSVERQRRAHPWLAERARVFSALMPLEQLVAELNDFQPVLLGGYPSALTLLAGEQEAGRLRVRPVLLSCAGEVLAPEARTQIESAFGCRLRDSYGASEVGAVALACGLDSMHVQSDWVVVEPVDENHRPVPPGEPSHTVLVTGLANRVQPIIRYDLGDTVTLEPEPCACGSPLPAVRVAGRTGDVLGFTGDGGREVAVLPLALATVIEETEGVRRCQAVQTGPSSLSIRLDALPGTDDAAVWHEAAARLERFLAARGLSSVEVHRDPRPPAADPRSGKFRQVSRASRPRPVREPAP